MSKTAAPPPMSTATKAESMAYLYYCCLVAGHSLGGALATLAAYDIQKAHGPLPGLHVYTYGAPRTGNHAFARDYEACVPHTWHVINDRDAVPRSGKFFMLYKRPGQRALINEVRLRKLASTRFWCW